jgi:alpha-mannosidase
MKDSALAIESYCLNIPVKLHRGKAVSEISYIESTSNNIVLDALKPAEDGRGLIMRVYDMLNISDRVKIKINFQVKEVFETDMLENDLNRIDINKGEISIDIGNFQVKTLRLII